MAVAGMGTKLLIGANSVTELTEIGGLEVSADTIETTTLDSGGWRTFIGGLKDGGEVSLSGYFNPADVNGQNAMYDALTAGTVLAFSIVFPGGLGANWSFNGVVTKYTTSSSMEDPVSFEATIKVTGAPNLGLTASTGLSALSLTGGGTLSPTFANGVYSYAYTYTTATTVTLTVTAASHMLKLYIDGTYSQDLTSGSASAAIAFGAGVSKKLTVIAAESGKTQKIYEVVAVRTA